MSSKYQAMFNELTKELGADKAKEVFTDVCFSKQNLVNSITQITLRLKNTNIKHKELYKAICPCKVEDYRIERAQQLFKQAANVKQFIYEMNKEKVIGKEISYDELSKTIYITKLSAKDCGVVSQSEGFIATHCHCQLLNHCNEVLPIDYCICSASFFYPLFEPLFGQRITIEPIETVLSGGKKCVFAIKL